jgi:hypothetical protein
VLVAVYLERQPVRLTLPEPARALLASTHPGAALIAPDALELRPDEAVVLGLS